MSAALDRATLGLRALHELYTLDDGLDDLVERAERALRGGPGKHHAGVVATFGRMQARPSMGDVR